MSVATEPNASRAKELRSVAAFGQRILEGVMSASQQRRPMAPHYGREAVIKTCSSQTSERGSTADELSKVPPEQNLRARHSPSSAVERNLATAPRLSYCGCGSSPAMKRDWIE